MKEDEVTLSNLESLLEKVPRHANEEQKLMRSVNLIQNLINKARSWKRKATAMEIEIQDVLKESPKKIQEEFSKSKLMILEKQIEDLIRDYKQDLGKIRDLK